MSDESGELSLLDSIRLLALRSVLDGDAEYKLRFISRWYSENFHTPLHIVDELPIEDVLLHFFERNFEEMDEDKRLTSVKELLETAEERKSRLIKESHDESDDADWFNQIMADVKAGRDPLKRDAAITKVKEDQLPDSFKKASKELGQTIKDLAQVADTPDEIDFKFDEDAFGKPFDPNEDWGLTEDIPIVKDEE